MDNRINTLRLVFLGPPGVGKGTQAQMLAECDSLVKISTGDILREAVSQKTPLGLQAKDFMETGRLVPDEVIIGVIGERLSSPDRPSGYVLDGFPRTLGQAEALSKMLEAHGTPLHRAISFEVPEKELIRRLTGRRSCPRCQRIYHLDFHPPQQKDQCDVCGEALIQREDDREETVRKRLRIYETETAPLLKFYEEQEILSKIDGRGSIEEVFKRLLQVLKGLKREP
ncbi:MAG: adenylate kinase [Nitrospiria bacterium]